MTKNYLSAQVSSSNPSYNYKSSLMLFKIKNVDELKLIHQHSTL